MQSEIISFSNFIVIVSTLVEKYEFKSLFKLEFTALLIANYMDGGIIKKTKSNPIKAFLKDTLSILFSRKNDFLMLNKAIKTLEKLNYFTISNDVVHQNKSINPIQLDCIDDYIDNVLKNIASSSLDSFAEELINYA